MRPLLDAQFRRWGLGHPSEPHRMRVLADQFDRDGDRDAATALREIAGEVEAEWAGRGSCPAVR